jgi:hypothetical protein
MNRGIEVARVWSFTDEFSEAPYPVYWETRNGWSCMCPHNRIRKRSCKHIKATRTYKDQTPEIQKRIQLTPEGAKHLGVKTEISESLA